MDLGWLVSLCSPTKAMAALIVQVVVLELVTS